MIDFYSLKTCIKRMRLDMPVLSEDFVKENLEGSDAESDVDNAGVSSL